MNVRFKKQFAKDLDKLSEAGIRTEIAAVIKAVEAVAHLGELANVKKLRGYKTAYRIRIGEYRLGLVVEGQEVVFVRVAHRRDIYRLFP